MYQFLLRPKWIAFHLLVIAAVIGMLSASKWQWDKYNARKDFVDLVEDRQDPDRTSVVALNALLEDTVDVDDIEFRLATAQGSYLSDRELLQINRTQDGVNGVNVLTPFQIEGGPIVVVNRGFVPDNVDPPQPPSGPLTIGGTVRVTQQRRTGQFSDDPQADSNEVRRVDLPLISQRLDLQIAPVYLEFIAAQKPAAVGVPPIPVPEPDLSGGPPHLSYAVQWLIFTISVIVGWVLAVRRTLRADRRRAAAASVASDGLSGGGLPGPPSA